MEFNLHNNSTIYNARLLYLLAFLYGYFGI